MRLSFAASNSRDRYVTPLSALRALARLDEDPRAANDFRSPAG
jgi:hypothetical protein